MNFLAALVPALGVLAFGAGGVDLQAVDDLLKESGPIVVAPRGIKEGDFKELDGTQAKISTWSVPVSIHDFVDLSLRKGISAEQVRLQYESAGYAKGVTYRQNMAPTLTANVIGTQGETYTNNALTKAESGETNMTISQPLPTGTQLSLTGKYNATLTRSPTASNHELLRPSLAATMTQPIFLFVKNPVLRTLRRTSLAYDSAGDTFTSGILNIKTQARSLYYDVLLKAETVGVQKRKFDASKALLSITRELVRAGKAAGVETNRSEVRVEQDRRSFTSAINEFNKSRQNAKSFANLPLDYPLEFVSRLAYEAFNISAEALIGYALAHQPQLLQLHRARELAKLDLDAAKEPGRPTLNLNGTLNSTETDSHFGVPPNATNIVRAWTAGATLSWLFFDSFITRDQVRQAKISRQLAELAYQDAARATTLSVRNAYMDVETAENQLLDFGPVRQSAHNNVEILRIQFRNGHGGIIDVFDAENQARDVDLQYLNLLVNYYVTQDRLAVLIGAELDRL